MMTIKKIALAGAMAAGLASTPPLHAQTLDAQTLTYLKQLWNMSTAQTVRLAVTFNPLLVNYVLYKLDASDRPYAQGFIKAATTNAPTLTPTVIAPTSGELPVITSSYTQIISFGDSMSDTGAMQQVSKAVTGYTFPQGPDGGRFCNGPVALEVMASRMNLPLTNYALGGAMTGQGNAIPLQGFQKGVQAQISDHLANLSSARQNLDVQALYVIWAGPNDFYARNGLELSSTAPQAASNISAAVATLYGKGARHFFIPNMPDLSLTPSALRHELFEPGYKAQALKRTEEFASAMKSTLASLKTRYPSAHITTFDTLTYLRNQIPLAKAQGINTTVACVQSTSLTAAPTVCADPDKHLFWDGNHPTAMANVQLGAQFATASIAP